MTPRTTVRMVGILFIVATAAVLGGVLLLLLDESDYLQGVDQRAGAPRLEEEQVVASGRAARLW